MTLLELLSQPAAQKLVLVLLHSLWQGAAAGLLLYALLRMVPSFRPQVRYTLAVAGLVAMAAAPCITFLALGEPRQLAETTVVPHDALLSTNGGVGTLGNAVALTPSESAEAASPATTGWEQWRVVVAPYVLLAWLGGVTMFATRLALGLFAVQWIARRRAPVPWELRSAAERLARRLGLRQAPRVNAGYLVGEAMVVGFFRPLVLLPAAWIAQLPPPVLEAVLAHELAHVRRRDVWVNLFQRVVETLLFYHPVVWWVSRRIRAERELCCDDLAVAATGGRAEYAEALECVARRRLSEESPLLATGIGGRKMALLRRVRHVLRLDGRGGPGSRAGRIAAGLVAVALPLGLWLAAGVLVSPAVGDDEDRPAARDEGEERAEGDARRDRDDERPRDGEGRGDDDFRRDRDEERPRDGEVRDRPRERDGDEAGRRGEGEGDPEPTERERQLRERFGVEGGLGRDRRPDAPPPPREGERFRERPDLPPPAVHEALLAEIRLLREEVEMLRREVRELRGERPPRGDRNPFELPPSRREGEGDRRPESDFRPDRPRGEGERDRRPESDFRPNQPRERDGGRPRPEGERDGDRPRPEGERDRGDRPRGEQPPPGEFPPRDPEPPRPPRDGERDEPARDGASARIPALGPAPRVFDLTTPILSEDDHDGRIFSFYVGLTR